MVFALAEYLDLSERQARAQWLSVLAREEPPAGKNQVDYLPIETLLCAAAMVALGAVTYGSGLAEKGPRPVPELATLLRRRRTSITSKMANLDGGRSRGGRHDQEVWATLESDPDRLLVLYRTILAAARWAGIDHSDLPDFLEAEAEEFVWLGQDELDESTIETALREAVADEARDDSPSERQVLARIRLGQHRFARGVLDNCKGECVFCGFSLDVGSSRTLLRASHIKPWRHSSDAERRDVRNGVAACPIHDAAFDNGDLTLDADLCVVVSRRVAASSNPAVRTFFDPPLLRKAVEMSSTSRPRPAYLAWHRGEIFMR